jgi:hypothetical protein
MKKNVLTIFALSATLVCNAAFAYVLVGEGHVSEPIITNNGISNFQFIEGPVSQEQIDQFSKKKVMSSSVNASISNVSGRVNQHIEVSGSHRVNIKNDTSQTAWFKYMYTLTINGRSTDIVRNVDLKPGGSFYASDFTKGDLNVTSPGSYRLSAQTKSEGPSASGSDISYATGTVSK